MENKKWFYNRGMVILAVVVTVVWIASCISLSISYVNHTAILEDILSRVQKSNGPIHFYTVQTADEPVFVRKVLTLNDPICFHTVQTTDKSVCLSETQNNDKTVFLRGESQYVPTREIALDYKEMEVFAQILVLEAGSTDIAEVSAVGCVYLNQYESSPNCTFIEVLQESPAYAYLNKFEDPEYLDTINEKGIYRVARLVADDLVTHNYRPFDSDVLHYGLINDAENLQDIFGNPIYETEHFVFFSDRN